MCEKRCAATPAHEKLHKPTQFHLKKTQFHVPLFIQNLKLQIWLVLVLAAGAGIDLNDAEI